MLSNELKDIITEIFHIGVGRSAAAMSELLDQTILMEVPHLYFMKREDVKLYLEESVGKYVCVTQNMYGELQGAGILSFPLVNGKTLVDQFLDTDSKKSEFGAMEISAIEEIGNIILSAVGAAFGDITQLRIEFDPPEVHFSDYAFPLIYENQPDTTFFSLANTGLKVQDIDIQGNISVMFAYLKVEVLEQFLSGHKIISQKFGQILIKHNYITPEQLEEALVIQRDSNKFIGELLVDKGFITEKQRNEILTSEEYKQSSKKFGEMLLEESLISEETLNEVIKLQKLSRSLLGEILVALGHLSEENRAKILPKK